MNEWLASKGFEPDDRLARGLPGDFYRRGRLCVRVFEAAPGLEVAVAQDMVDLEAELRGVNMRTRAGRAEAREVYRAEVRRRLAAEKAAASELVARREAAGEVVGFREGAAWLAAHGYEGEATEAGTVRWMRTDWPAVVRRESTGEWASLEHWSGCEAVVAGSPWEALMGAMADRAALAEGAAMAARREADKWLAKLKTLG